MNKETAIFLSSTWEDLKDHRRAVLHMLAQLKRQVESMEYFGARPDEPLDVCLDAVRKSGIYIGIIGTRYGTLAKDGKSFTHLEYEEALTRGKRILMYIIDDENHPVLLKYVDMGKNAQRLSEFKTGLLSKHVCKRFSSPDNLAGQVSIDLIKLFEDIGENVRAALGQNNLNRLLFEAGFTFSKEMALYISLDSNEKDRGGFRFGDRDLETIMAAAFLAQNIQHNKFDILRNFVTLRHEVWELVVFFLKRSGFDEKALLNEIINCDESIQLRLLISLAGRLEAASCAEVICKRLFDTIPHDKIIWEYQIQVTPFNKVVENALAQLPLSTRPLIQKYAGLAKTHKMWQAKQVINSALKKQEARTKT